jgi:hypothetical protein
MFLCCFKWNWTDWYLDDWFSATSNSILDRAIDSEDALHKDFIRLVRSSHTVVYLSKHLKHPARKMVSNFQYVRLSCRSTLKGTMSCQQKQKCSFPLRWQYGMLTSTSRWMMMSMSIWVCTASTSLFLLSSCCIIITIKKLFLNYYGWVSYMSCFCRYASYNSCPSPFKTQSLHWVYEIWTCSFSKVILLNLMCWIEAKCYYFICFLPISAVLY